MLLTRCPDCETTFRITADALQKAGGQVRCGRCACVFNAYTELHRHDGTAPEAADPSPEPATIAGAEAVPTDAAAATPAEPLLVPGAEPAPGARAAAATPAPDDPRPVSAPAVHRRAAADPKAPPGTPARGPSVPPPEARAAASVRKPSRDVVTSLRPPKSDSSALDDMTIAKVIAQLESSSVDDDASGTSEAGVTGSSSLDDREAEAILEREAPRWILAEPETKSTTRRWAVGCALALAFLAAQITHHFRAEIAGTQLVGPLLQDAYAMLGTEVTPRWNLDQYEIVDWVAVAEPSARGQGSLKIAAQIRNEGPRAQPFPHVHVQLKDRWENSIGSRIFAPDEYLGEDTRADLLMPPGAITRAELDIVDPGPDAYGFELDVCVEGEAHALRCAADAVFR
ncbi:MAG TPA: DUF3426 domain-containing protein [Gammaproteobacteria bacterium]